MAIRLMKKRPCAVLLLVLTTIILEPGLRASLEDQEMSISCQETSICNQDRSIYNHDSSICNQDSSVFEQLTRELGPKMNAYEDEKEYGMIYVLFASRTMKGDGIQLCHDSKLLYKSKRIYSYPMEKLNKVFSNYGIVLPQNWKSKKRHVEEILTETLYPQMKTWISDNFNGATPKKIYIYTYLAPCPICADTIEKFVKPLLYEIPIVVGFSSYVWEKAPTGYVERVKELGEFLKTAEAIGTKLLEIPSLEQCAIGTFTNK